jgi:hypothetical protein
MEPAFFERRNLPGIDFDYRYGVASTVWAVVKAEAMSALHARRAEVDFVGFFERPPRSTRAEASEDPGASLLGPCPEHARNARQHLFDEAVTPAERRGLAGVQSWAARASSRPYRAAAAFSRCEPAGRPKLDQWQANRRLREGTRRQLSVNPVEGIAFSRGGARRGLGSDRTREGTQTGPGRKGKFHRIAACVPREPRDRECRARDWNSSRALWMIAKSFLKI